MSEWLYCQAWQLSCDGWTVLARKASFWCGTVGGSWIALPDSSVYQEMDVLITPDNPNSGGIICAPLFSSKLLRGTNKIQEVHVEKFTSWAVFLCLIYLNQCDLFQ